MRGDCEAAFQSAAAQDGVTLVRATAPWLNQRGHFGLPLETGAAITTMSAILVLLGGDPVAQQAKRTTPLPGDFVHSGSGTYIEVDEHQHFTSARLATLNAYPPGTKLGFELDRYLDLCQQWSERSDSYYRRNQAPGFGPGGRQRQRAYHDALRDLATPALGYGPVLRADAVDRDGAAAYKRVRDRVHAAIFRP